MKNQILHQQTFFHLSSIHLENTYPLLDNEIIAWIDLKQDPHYSFIPPDQVSLYIESSIACGRNAAQPYLHIQSYSGWINLLLKHHIKVRFLSEPKHDRWIRALYIPKLKTIQIYRSSIEQLRSFFLAMDYPVYEEDLIVLHLAHEFYHYLEENDKARTDLQVPKVIVKRWGPFIWKETVSRTREIAAHTFTQTIFGIPWSPFHLDIFLQEHHKGTSKHDLRLLFHRWRQEHSETIE
ncbi:hypothetical protein SAMN04487866_11521 [Thermoactinomyces sp. DSM 45891]|uniref:hypothetical protein n=1 Tax=Thermoactinomyces sp. DSM 45891 TaxID=1761907 RepID=UPI0009195DF3|nr:hypothetical protein [Thermoactinomyces sp. DSM 45891]SFX64605.1 hypothetical protein SAMN04487866_11521 [Thermoactinomyces sp. DSM 45891]